MKTRAFAILALFAACLAACSPPKYARYNSVSGDFSVYVPWGWNVIAEASNDNFSEVKFLGPRDKDFYLGTPSLSIRWFKDYRSHQLRGARLEMYEGPADFISQTMKDVYGRDAVIVAGDRQLKDMQILDNRNPIPTQTLAESGLGAKVFAVFSQGPAAPGTVGAVKDVDGNWHNLRYHEYAVIPMGGGFYVLSYPATKAGHDKGIEAFHVLINTFHPYTDGPGGPKVQVRRAVTPKR